jgi:hypothetical protein
VVASDRTELERLYRTEPDPSVKERLLLVLMVQGDDMVLSRAARAPQELDRDI